MMDWLGKMLELPEAFLAGRAGEGGGVIQVRWGKWGRRPSGRVGSTKGLSCKQKPVPLLLRAVPLAFFQRTGELGPPGLQGLDGNLDLDPGAAFHQAVGEHLSPQALLVDRSVATT